MSIFISIFLILFGLMGIAFLFYYENNGVKKGNPSSYKPSTQPQKHKPYRNKVISHIKPK